MFFLKKNLGYKRIIRKNIDIEPQEILLDRHAQREDSVGFKRLETPLKRKSFTIIIAIFLSLFFLIGLKTIQIQLFEHKKFVAYAQRNKFIVNLIQAQRGVIYDKKFNQLVFNKPNFSLACSKKQLLGTSDKSKRELSQLAWILKDSADTLKKRIENEEDSTILLKKSLDFGTLILLESNLNQLPDCEIKRSVIREYKDGPVFSHIIGYWQNKKQSTGLEKYYNNVLLPSPGKILKERNSKGKIIGEKIISLPHPGDSLVLSLDAELQTELTKTLEAKMREFGAKRAAAVALDPNNGAVLALVSLPNFDNNLFSSGISQNDWQKLLYNPNKPLFNRAIAGLYPTGSIIKPLIGSAALQEKVISKDKTINCKGKIVVANPWHPDKPFVFHDWKIHGITDLKKAIAQSCNVYFYIVGGGYKNFKGLGVERIKKYLSLFGWTQKLGIDLPGEAAGFVPDKQWKKKAFKFPNNIWLPGDTYHLSIGQGYLAVTPLEVADSFGAIANGGKLFQPHIVQRIIDESRKIKKVVQPKLIRKDFIAPDNLAAVREGMRETVLSGTGRIFQNLPVTSAAKTGTAQLSPELTKKGYYNNWVVVFAPYEHPKIVLTIVVERVKGMHLTAIPVADEVLKRYFSRNKE